jgi:hypothetical protein
VSAALTTLGTAGATGTAGTGLTLIPSSSPLTRLHFFDGKLLRAQDLELEQRYVLQLAALSNQAGGPGVVHGFDCVLGGGDTLQIGAGLAIDGGGRVLLLGQETSVGIGDLIAASRRAAAQKSRTTAGSAGFQPCEMKAEQPPGQALDEAAYWLITVCHAEAFCGEEDVYGALCESACVTSTQRPYIVEGVVVQAVPLTLRTPLIRSASQPFTRVHLRSRVASAYFEDERQRVASLISREGLASEAWCLGAQALGAGCVPIGVVARSGDSTIFLDAWTARRERMDAPPRQYWAWRMAMRPWNVFLAQVLQFQCQLSDLFSNGDGPVQDPCQTQNTLLGEAARGLGTLLEYYGKVAGRLSNLNLGDLGDLSALQALQRRLAGPSVSGISGVLAGNDKILLRRGIVELPSAGYLPVVPGSNLTVNQQVSRLLGPGVDLRFCIVRPDFVAHALEEAQHMERISLVQGLDDPKLKPEVDILVPDGKIAGTSAATGLGFEAELNVPAPKFIGADRLALRGVARAEVQPSGGGALYFAGSASVYSFLANRSMEAQALNDLNVPRCWAELRCAANPFALPVAGSATASLRAVLARGKAGPWTEVRLQGDLRIEGPVGGGHVSGLFDGYMVNTSNETGTAKSDAAPLRLSAEIVLQGDAAVGGLTLKAKPVDEKDGSFEIEVTWKGVPRQAEGSLSIDSETTPTATANLLESTEALRIGGPPHQRAMDALADIGQALADKGFADAAARLLFAVPPAAGGLEVTAVRDWVLFHRRRTKTCAVVAETPAAAPARRYKVFHLKETPQFLDKILSELDKGESLSADLRPVTEAGFASALSTLTTNPADLVKAWKDAEPGPALYAAVIATKATADDGDSLALARLGKLDTEIETATPEFPGGAKVKVLAKLPPNPSAADADGIIVLLTVEQVASICQTVYRITPSSFVKLMDMLGQSGQTTDKLASFFKEAATLLGAVSFQGETEELVEGSETDIVTKWNKAQVQRMLLLVNPGTLTSAIKSMREKQGKVLQKALGEAGGNFEILIDEAKVVLPGDCPTVVFAVAADATTKKP